MGKRLLAEVREIHEKFLCASRKKFIRPYSKKSTSAFIPPQFRIRAHVWTISQVEPSLFLCSLLIPTIPLVSDSSCADVSENFTKTFHSENVENSFRKERNCKLFIFNYIFLLLVACMDSHWTAIKQCSKFDLSSQQFPPDATLDRQVYIRKA